MADGLKKMRKVQSSKPHHYCKNCEKMRYSPCGCSLKKGKEREIELRK